MSTRRVDCPTSEALAELAGGMIESGQRDRLLDHLIECADCAEELRAVGPVHEVLVTKVRTRQRMLTPMLRIAAAALIVIGAGWWTTSLWPTASETYRGAGSSTLAFSPSDGAELEGPPDHLAIPDSTPGESFQVELFDENLELLFTSEPASIPRVELSDELRSRLLPGHTFTWRVVVLEGGVERRLPSAEFTILP